MSWLARSIADTLGIDDDVDQSGDERDQPQGVEDVYISELDSSAREAESDGFKEEEETDEDCDDPSRGVKEDFTELKQTLTRQFWGVASFLAPPAPPPPPPPRLDRKERDLNDEDVYCDGKGEILADEEEEELHLDEGMNLRNGSDFEEETDIASSILDTNAAPSSVEEEEEDEVLDVVGITEEVLTFGRNIAMHPETWLDYPIEEEDDPDGT